MNLFKVSEILLEEGISHRSISPTAIRMDWIIDGASKPVVLYDVKTNQATHMPAHSYMREEHQNRIERILKRCKFTNTH